jgi:hypothetical protein
MSAVLAASNSSFMSDKNITLAALISCCFSGRPLHLSMTVLCVCGGLMCHKSFHQGRGNSHDHDQGNNHSVVIFTGFKKMITPLKQWRD